MIVINAITGGCKSPKHLTKTQRKDQRTEVGHISSGKVFKTDWSHIPITFTEVDLKLKNH
jgi:hypothetical protein